MSSSSQTPMEQALRQASRAALSGEVPVGAVILYQGRIIAQAFNQVITACDPTAHAEIIVLRQASLFLKSVFLTECDLYVTLEPCAMCAQAISWARLRRLIFGAYDPKGGAVDHGVRLYDQRTCLHRPEWIGGVEETAAQQLLKSFFRELR